MQLHEISVKKAKRARRIGRSGKRGSYSGRGIKGQKSRAGHRIRPASRDLIQRIPKRRGFKNPPGPKPLVINLDALAKAKVGVNKLDLLRLKELGLVSRRYQGKVKILGTGSIDFPVVIAGLRVSKSAEEKIVKAGGKVLKPGS